MKIRSALFGEITIEEDQLITFPQGLPGFEDLRRFILVHPDEQLPFSYLQSAEEEALSFILTDPYLFEPSYEFQLPDSAVSELEIESEQDVLVRAIVTIKDKVEDATMNLLAPVVFNVRRRLAKQVILHDTDYQTKHRLIPQDTRRTEVDAHARSNP